MVSSSVVVVVAGSRSSAVDMGTAGSPVAATATIVSLGGVDLATGLQGLELEATLHGSAHAVGLGALRSTDGDIDVTTGPREASHEAVGLADHDLVAAFTNSGVAELQNGAVRHVATLAIEVNMHVSAVRVNLEGASSSLDGDGFVESPSDTGLNV